MGGGGWWWKDKREAEREGWDGFQGEMRKLLGVMDICIILIVIMVSWVYMYVKAY